MRQFYVDVKCLLHTVQVTNLQIKWIEEKMVKIESATVKGKRAMYRCATVENYVFGMCMSCGHSMANANWYHLRMYNVLAYLLNAMLFPNK